MVEKESSESVSAWPFQPKEPFHRIVSVPRGPVSCWDLTPGGGAAGVEVMTPPMEEAGVEEAGVEEEEEEEGLSVAPEEEEEGALVTEAVVEAETAREPEEPTSPALLMGARWGEERAMGFMALLVASMD